MAGWQLNTQRLVIANVAAAFYNLAVMWLFQLDVYPSWRFVPTIDFGPAQTVHFFAVVVAVFPASVIATVTSIVLVLRRPRVVPPPILRAGAALQALSWVMTAALLGPWQGKLTDGISDAARLVTPERAVGPANETLYHAFMYAHWGRVLLVSLYAFLAWWIAQRVFARHGDRRSE